MDIGKAFSFPFEDEQWVSSILICGALLLLPIVGWLAIGGYALETARNVMMGSPRPLPKWDTFGEKLRLGFGWFVVYLGWSLPAVVVGFLGFCLFLPALSGDEAAMAAAAGTFTCLVSLAAIFSLVLIPFSLAATARYVQTDSIGEAFKVGEVVGMVRADLGGWLVLFLLSLLCSIVGQLGGYIIIGIFFTLPYSQAVFGHLLGQKLRTLPRPGAGLDYAPPVPPTSF